LIELEVDEALLRDARRHAVECGTRLEAPLTAHLVTLADRAGRRLTLREQIYSDYRAPEDVVEALRAEGLRKEGKAQ
jgi:hypothetical protein